MAGNKSKGSGAGRSGRSGGLVAQGQAAANMAGARLTSNALSSFSDAAILNAYGELNARGFQLGAFKNRQLAISNINQELRRRGLA